jgi:hypothetical protein
MFPFVPLHWQSWQFFARTEVSSLNYGKGTAALSAWWREAYQRSAAIPYILSDFPTRRLLVLATDADEIPSQRLLRDLHVHGQAKRDEIHDSAAVPTAVSGSLHLSMAMYTYSWNWRDPGLWFRGFVTTDAVLRRFHAYGRSRCVCL